ncbi:MAG: 2-nitropropane dioxygenase [Spirochaetae bacterium HGW-Spirochaetae-8]|nr:MAG: 2-nitropropane dioxygenase [Spirochaetae bacterium HGW-Spirochaetae-8]
MNLSGIDSALSNLRKLTEEFSQSLPFKGLWETIRHLSVPNFSWPELRIGNLVARIPIVQGGMGVGISLSGLASAVAEAGGIGVIAANGIGLIEKDYYQDGRAANLRALRKEIRKAREKTKGIIGVNIMVALDDFHQLLDVTIEEKADIVFMGAGLPIKDLPVAKMRESGIKVAPIVSSARATDMIFRMWKKIYQDVPDAVVFEGPLAGGHLGFTEEQLEDPNFQLEHLVPQIVDALAPYEKEFGRSIPVIAGGGVYTGQDIHAVLSLGASAVQMATRFVATDECDADQKFKQAYVDCTKEQIGIIKSPVGMPGRAIRNEFIIDAENGKRPTFKCAWQCLASCKADDANYCISIALNNARRGYIRQGFVFVGANAYRVDGIVPVASLVDELGEGYRLAARETIGQRLAAMVASIQDLLRQQEGLGARVKETAIAYEKALTIHLRDFGRIPLEQLRLQYEAVLATLRDVQFQIAEAIADSWALVTQQRLAVPVV